MNSHVHRMAYLGRFAVLSKKRLEDLQPAGIDLKISSHAKRQWAKMQALFIAQQTNGAGLEMDQNLRYFHQEYNSRTWKHGLETMPASFNVLEAFFEFVPSLLLFRIRKEFDHLLSMPDFFDFTTSPSISLDLERAAEGIQQGAIYSYGNLSPLGALTFRGATGKKYAVGGLSFILHGSELSVLLVGGEESNTAEETARLKSEDIKFDFRTPGKEGIEPAKDLERKAVPLLDDPGYWRTLAFARLDITHRTIEARYVMRDCGDVFLVETDDPSGFLDNQGKFLTPDLEDHLKEAARKVQESNILFEICSLALHLPTYFEHFGDNVIEERHKTIYGERVPNASFAKIRNGAPPEERVAHRRVSILTDQVEAIGSDEILLRAPSFKMETSGYWSRLKHDQVGADKYGHPIHGKTWVTRKLTWIESDRESAPILAQRSTKASVEENSSLAGFIYVMRNAAHAKNVFKVGFTTGKPEDRADQLSRNTASLDKFHIMHEWAVSDCRRAEKQIHDRINSYRLNPNREFFEIPFKELVRVINEVTSEIDGQTGE